MERIEQLLGRAKYKLAVDTDFNYRIILESKLKPVKNNFNKIISTVSQDQIFKEERLSSTKYRLLGRLNVITDNSINILDTNNIVRPTNEDWDPLFDGENISNNTPPQTPNNWVLQIMYPHTMDKNTHVEQNEAHRGITIKNIYATNVSGTKDQLLIETLQKNKLEEGDHCYIYSITHTTQYNGIHEIEFIGENGTDNDYKLRLRSNFNGLDSGLLLKRIVNPSEDDLNFSNPKNMIKVVSCDYTGGTTNGNYLKVNTGNLLPSFSASTHNLRVADYVDFRADGNNFILNGLHRVTHVVDRYNYVIDLKITNVAGLILDNLNTLYRRLDGIPCDYYIRKFKLLSTNNYEVNKATNFGTSIYTKTITNSIGVANDTWLFTFIDDINTQGLYNHRGGPLLELNFATIKRSGQNTFDWSNVTAHWDFQSTYAENGNKIETVSTNVINGVGSIEKKFAKIDEYFGDFVEYNRRELTEKIISEVIHRFALNENPTPENGYYIKPFQQIYIRRYSNLIEEADFKQVVVGIPGDSELKPNGNIIWRDVLEPGFIEEGNNGVDYPFLNGASYIYLNKYIYVIRQTTPKELITKTVDPLIIC
jgi:hypothetical protein